MKIMIADHEVLAIKPFSSEDKTNYVVIRNWNSVTPYAVHTYNAKDNAFYCGVYTHSWERAIEIFNKTGV